MGKTSRTSSRISRPSLTANSSKHKMSNNRHKKRRDKQRNKRKLSNNINKVLDNIRKEASLTSIDVLSDTTEHELSANSVLVLRNAAILETSTEPNNLKRKLSEPNTSSKRKKDDESEKNSSNHEIIVINDSISKENGSETPRKQPVMQCSTPINKDHKAIANEFIPSPKNNNTNLVTNFNKEVTDLTKEINGDDYVTIDLTTETLNNTSIEPNTIIDLEDTHTETDCTVVSVSKRNSGLSLSGDSDVTVIRMTKNKTKKQMKKLTNGIAQMDAVQKGKLLELITQNIFKGCNTSGVEKIMSQKSQVLSKDKIETVEDTYIKEIILCGTKSRNSIGSNIYNPAHDAKNRIGLRMIVVDGSNVAMEHGKGRQFSVKGLKICIDYFLKRGHVVKAFVPRFRCKFGKSTDPRLLDDLERQGLVVYTPSREIQGRTVTPYDDRYIVQCAAEFDGVIVSGDNYKDLLVENPRWRFVIENRLLQFTWVNDMIMFPRDPLGRHGPTLEQFLKHPSE